MSIDLNKLREQAEQGNTTAQTIVGSYLLDGINAEPNHEKAFELLSRAAGSGSPRAMFHLARMYAEGIFVEIDSAKAQSLFEAASEKGEFLAHIYLARIHLLTDQAQAAIYYQRAADLRDVLMDSEEMQEALDFLASALNPLRDPQ